MFWWFRKYVRKIGIFGVEVEFHPPTETVSPATAPKSAEPTIPAAEAAARVVSPPAGSRAVGSVAVDKVALRDLLEHAPGFFICNTNRRHFPSGEGKMRERLYAAVWETFAYPAHMQRVTKGDAIFMWAKGVGIIGVGRALDKHEILEVSAHGRIRTSAEHAEREWRIPVEWMVWVDHDKDAYRYTMPNASFIDASGENYHDLREGVRKHFLGVS